tara:strand:+ start:563 stop:1042 length:480 start_codon:yes stop_codon:yes gene_type:complete
MRPRFSLKIPLAPSEVHRRLESQLARSECPCQSSVVGKHIEVTIRDDLRHFWSPHLSLELNPDADGSVLAGLFGPSPNVWTLFLAAYGFLALTAFFSGILGLVQVSLGDPAWGLALAGGSILACALPYAASQVGRSLAAEQMEELRRFLRESLSLEGAA